MSNIYPINKNIIKYIESNGSLILIHSLLGSKNIFFFKTNYFYKHFSSKYMNVFLNVIYFLDSEMLYDTYVKNDNNNENDNYNEINNENDLFIFSENILSKYHLYINCDFFLESNYKLLYLIKKYNILPLNTVFF